jgi:hypothetical protein
MMSASTIEKLEDLINSVGDALQILSNDIEIGSNPRLFEVHAKLSKLLSELHLELYELNKLKKF